MVMTGVLGTVFELEEVCPRLGLDGGAEPVEELLSAVETEMTAAGVDGSVEIGVIADGAEA